MIYLITIGIAIISFYFGFHLAGKISDFCWSKLLYEFLVYSCRDANEAKRIYSGFLAKTRRDVAIERARIRNHFFKYRS